VCVCVCIYVSPSFWRVVFPFWSLRLAFSLTIFCVSVVTITAHNGQLLWTVKRTMELPRLSRMSNRQTVRFTASGQTAGRTIVHVATQLDASRGFEAKTCAAEVRSWAVKKSVFVRETWKWNVGIGAVYFGRCGICVQCSYQWHLAYTDFSSYYIEAFHISNKPFAFLGKADALR
jgi:hypothetical protein